LTENTQPGAWLLKTFVRAGVDAQKLTQRLPEEIHQMMSSPETVTPEMVNTILLECAVLSGDSNFGLRMIELTQTSDLGIYGYLLLHAPTVGKALEIACRYYPTFYLGATLNLSIAKDVASLTYRVDAPATLPARHDNEWSLGFFVHIIRRGASADWVPARSTFTHAAPEELQEQRRVFGPNVRFEHAVNSIEFSTDVLRYRINAADPGLLGVLTQHADNLLAKITREENLASHVRLLILKGLDSGSTNAADIAGRLNISVSTLKRRLKQEDLSYRRLRDGVVEEIAKAALKETRVPVTEIALRAGYAEVSAFDRAFVRITGMTPLQYRAREAREAKAESVR
jgi:AraC-like DNA-binding protein